MTLIPVQTSTLSWISPTYLPFWRCAIRGVKRRGTEDDRVSMGKRSAGYVVLAVTRNSLENTAERSRNPWQLRNAEKQLLYKLEDII